MSRVIILVLDSIGIGALPDAKDYGDIGSNTFGNVKKAMFEKEGRFNIPNLIELGFTHIEGVEQAETMRSGPIASYGRANEKSNGKDTIIGHWEIAGLYTKEPLEAYMDGFSDEFIKEFEKKIGREVIGNYAASGTEIIEQLGPEHEKTGKPIVYTSVDSCIQIAANTEVIPLEKLYEICAVARQMLPNIGRVIARPYIIKDGKRIRTYERRDLAISPSGETLLDKVKKLGQTVYAIGKINDVFNGQGVTIFVDTEGNMDTVDKTIDAIKKDFEGLIFSNLVDFDSKYGHRRDPIGYGRAIEEFDQRIPEILTELKEDDILIMCADHGNDPTHIGTNHTREYIPIIVYGKNIKTNINLGTRDSFADIGATTAEILGVESLEIGTSFYNQIKN